MSQLLDMGLRDEESDSGETQDAEWSSSRCSSSCSILTHPMKVEKCLEGSVSLETAWTDSKHSSYLDFMEANFVQNMFARSYCMEDVCGGIAHHHHHQHDCRTDFEENDYNTAESQLHSQETLEYKIHDWGDQTWSSVLRAKAPATIHRGLLANPWVQHFRPRNAPSVSLKMTTVPNNEVAKRDAESQEIRSPAINNVDHQQWTANSISASDPEKPSKPVVASGRIVHQNAGETKDCLLNASSIDASVELGGKWAILCRVATHSNMITQPLFELILD
ncbi:hypothetical protein GOP47_0013457 [Adiantum capillus-veneris]|uniref:Uncharacterized protein n=1 Tax=Adiantum capillus-veneris TaxID=13818 RepID=A0A9D4UP91_ADICA|nr:hypothetical protein GOP47_0013457 [Adiantum capillus-veneris]